MTSHEVSENFAGPAIDAMISAMTTARWWRWLGAGGCMVAVAFALQCGDSGGSTFSDCAGAGAGGLCGKACHDDGECGAGLYCGGNVCTAECGPSKACAGSVACSASGRCSGGGFGGDGSTTDPGDDSGAGCADLSVTLTTHPPTIMLLIDRSGSMSTNKWPLPGSPGTRWTTLKDALLDGGVIKSLQSEVAFGASMYSRAHPPACPDLEGVPYAFNNYGAVNGLLAPADTAPDTPTGESILGICGITDGGITPTGLAALDAGGGDKVILLITDGDPDYCANPLANDEPDAAQRQIAKNIAVDAVQRAHAAGVKTYVLAIGDEVAASHQQEMANAGLGFARDAGDAAPFFNPADETQLTAQINSIVFGSRACSYMLSANVQSGFESKGTVRLNGAALGYNDPNGWKLVGSNQVELEGTACTTVRTTANVALTATFPCGAIVK